MPVQRKGLRDLRTRRARADTAAPVYTVYMRISCIEMEKSRRELERQAAQHRLALVEGRLRSLEHEKAALLEAAGAPSQDTRQATSSGIARGRFRIRY